MSVSLLAALLWIPFGIVVIIAGAIFLTAGYKRGLWRALISTGATVVATLISVLISNLISKPIAGAMINALPMGEATADAIPTEFFMTMVKGVVGVLVSLVLFSVFLFVFSIVLKCVCNRIKSEKLDVEKRSLQWAGLGVRLVDTVLFALLLLLPLYGTVATYVPTVQVVMQMQEKPDSETQAYIDAIAAHPVVQMSGNGPAAWVYTGLSNMQVGDGNVNVADMATTLQTLADKVMVMSTAESHQLPELAQDMVQFLRKNVIEADWCYDLTQELLAMAEESLRSEISPEEQGQVDAMMALFRMSREEFKENGIRILDMMSYLLTTGVLENEETAQAVVESEEFLTRLGDLMNGTDQMVAAKVFLLRMTIQEDIFQGDVQAATEFMAGRISETATEIPQRGMEAKALMMLSEADSKGEYAEALSLLPSFQFTLEEADKLPDRNADPYADYYQSGVVIPDQEYNFTGEGGAVTGIIRDENGNMVIVDGEGNITGSVIYGDPEDVSDVPMYTIVIEN